MEFTAYDGVIKKISNQVSPTVLGLLGEDNIDLESQLRFVSWDTQLKFQDNFGFCTPAERRYVIASLYNYARAKYRHKQVWTNYCNSVLVDPPSTIFLNLIGQLEARNALQKLQATMPVGYNILKRVGEAGDITSAYDSRLDQSPRTFRRRVNQLRMKARSILNGEEERKKTTV